MREVWHVLEHALLDTLKIAPILLVVYFLIEFLEYKRVMQFQHSKMLKGKSSPVFGSLFGSLPQCGFSVISTDLYTKGTISVGALLAVYIATSDEALPIMLSHGDSWLSLLALILCKIVLGIVVGYLAMWLYPKVFKTKNLHYNIQNLSNDDKVEDNHKEHNHDHNHNEHHSHETSAMAIEHTHISEKVDEDKHSKGHNHIEEDVHEHHSHKGHTHEDEHSHNSHKHEENSHEGGGYKQDKEIKHPQSKLNEHEHIGCCNHDLETSKFDWKHPLLHCIKIILFILIINTLFSAIVEAIGKDKLTNFLSQSSALQPFLAVLIGLIPNCASSVVITELYLLGGLSFGAILAGLSVNAGLGLMVLFKQNKKPKEIAFILAMLIIPSLLVGYGLHFII